MAAPLTFGIAFATADFTVDPNLSPNNQQFANAVLAVCGRAGLPFGFESSNAVLAGPAAGAAGLPAYRALVAADVPASILPGGFTGFANPSATVGTAAVNGVATTAMRSDGAPAINLTMSPTMTGNWVFAPSANVALALTGLAGKDTLQITSNSTANAILALSGASATRVLLGLGRTAREMYYGIEPTGGGSIISGSAAADFSLATTTGNINFSVNNGGAIIFRLVASGAAIQGLGPTAGALVDMTPDTGSFNGTLASVTTTVTCPCVWARNGNVVVLVIGTGTGTSNANTFTIGGLPAAITPARVQRLEVPDYAVENSGAIGSITTDVEMVMNTNGTMTMLNGGTATGWGATLFKGVAAAFTTSYLLN